MNIGLFLAVLLFWFLNFLTNEVSKDAKSTIFKFTNDFTSIEEE